MKGSRNVVDGHPDRPSFLAEAAGNIVSAGFKFLCKTDLEESEAKDFSAKNIPLNIYKEKGKERVGKEMKGCLIIEVEEIQFMSD